MSWLLWVVAGLAVIRWVLAKLTDDLLRKKYGDDA